MDYTIKNIAKKGKREAGAELCQAQFRLGLAKPVVDRLPPSRDPVVLAFYPAS
jgi:hypothetical protein